MLSWIIRPIRIEDAEDINEIRRQPGVMDATLALPSESIDSSRQFISALGRDDHLLVAEAEGKVVGMAGLHVYEGRRRHMAGVGISVHHNFQGAGLGKALMQALLDIADNYLKLVRLELEVWEGNDRAIKLYQSLGFENEGRKRQYVIYRGQYADALIMSRIKVAG